jgi:hypothetical protein
LVIQPHTEVPVAEARSTCSPARTAANGAQSSWVIGWNWAIRARTGPRRPYRRPRRREEARRSGSRVPAAPALPVGAASRPEGLRPPVLGTPPGSGAEPEPERRLRGRPAMIDTRFRFGPDPTCPNYRKLGPRDPIVGNGHEEGKRFRPNG